MTILMRISGPTTGPVFDALSSQRNQFGGNFSGPIWSGKRLFFFGGYEGLRQGSPNTNVSNVPTDLQRRGDFSQTRNTDGSLAVIYNPFTTRARAIPECL